jgi:peptidoglycan glycosyltransferase
VRSEQSGAALERGRERLLADDPTAARAAFLTARRWPATAGGAAGGLALADALQGLPPAEVPALADLAPLRPVVVLGGLLRRGDLSPARATAQLLLRAGHPLGPLYAAAIALERGEDEEARQLAARSPLPLSTVPLGRELARALEARDRGVGALVRDRNGELVGMLSSEGTFELADGVDPRLLRAPLSEVRWPEGHPGGIRLTLDLGLSRLAEEALGQWRGSIVLLEPRTGDVLVALSDERTTRTEGAAAFRQRREPASIAKIVTTAAAYRAGVDADEQISHMTCRGVDRFGGQPLWCSWAAGPLAGLDQALAISCNIAFARLGVDVGRDGVVSELRRWGFDAGPDRLLGAAGRVTWLPRNARQLADLSIGLTYSDITPLHAALLATVVADGGTMPEPRVVEGTCGPLGLHDTPVPAAPGVPVVEADTTRHLLRAMRAVAIYGTGAGLASPDLPVAMKTGTAAEYRKGYHVNYVGFAPPEDPVVAFCIRITHRPTSHAVTRAARDVARTLFAGLADRRLALARAARRQEARAQ